MSKPNITKLLTALTGPGQTLENAMIQIRDQRNVNDATGATLDLVGKFVMQPRNGITDDELYRRFVRARIGVQHSVGLVEHLITVVRQILGEVDGAPATVKVKTEGVAAVRVRVVGVANVDLLPELVDLGLVSFLGGAVKAGVRIIFEYPTAAPADAFAFAGGVGLGFTGHDRLDLGLTWPNADTVVGARTPGPRSPQQTIAFVADGTGAGTLDDDADAVFHFDEGITTVADFEAAVAASSFLCVLHAGTGAAVLDGSDVQSGTLAGAPVGGKFSAAADNASEPVFG